MPEQTPELLFLAPLDVIVILLYLAGVLLIGFRSSWRTRGKHQEFLIAGRTLTVPVFVATLVSTWYGGILGVGEFSYSYGVSTWVVFGFPYYLFAFLYAMFLAPRIRRSGVVSLPDKLEEVYGRPAALTGSVLTFLLVNPAPYVLMLGLLGQMVFGGSLLQYLVAGVLVSVVFLLFGGLRAGVSTNMFEFVLMYVGFAVLLFTAINEGGGIPYLVERLPESYLTPFGEHSAQYIAVWFFIALWTIVDPSFHQRCAAAKDERTARRGILVSIVFWFIFDMMTVTTGMFARAYLPNLEHPALAYPELANLMLSEGVLGIFYVGLLATVMSTLTSMSQLAGVTAGRDIFARWKGRSDERTVRWWVRFGILGAMVLSVLLAWALPSVVELWYAVGTALIPGLLLPVLSAYNYRLWIEGPQAVYAMIAGSLVSTGSLIVGYAGGDGATYPFGLEPIIPGLVVSAVLWFGFLVMNKRKMGQGARL